MISLETIPRMSEIANMLGNESRLILLQLISEGEKSVEMLSEKSGLPVASTSQQLQILKKANMVTTRRDGKRILYRLEPGPIRELFESLEKFAIFREVNQVGTTRIEPNGPKVGLSVKELQLKLKKGGIVLVDVRSREEYKKGHIPEAINIPFQELESHKFPKNKLIVVYCRGPLCVLSINAVSFLKSKDIQVMRLDSGFSGWSEEI